MTKWSYWKWDDKYNSDSFFIGEIIENETINSMLELENEGDDNKKWYKIKDVPFTNICINHENEIIGKAFYRYGREDFEIEKLKIKEIFMKKVHDHLRELLVETDEFYKGRKLVIAFGDYIVAVAFIK